MILQGTEWQKVLGSEDSYQKRKQGKSGEKAVMEIRRYQEDLQNPVYIGAAVYGKTKQMLAQNIPFDDTKSSGKCVKMPGKQLERAIYEKAQEIAKERWKDTLDNCCKPKEKQGADGPFKEGFSVDIAENALEG
ncbi:MAG: hypothetical protein ACLT4D_11715 [Blautia faecis]